MTRGENKGEERSGTSGKETEERRVEKWSVARMEWIFVYLFYGPDRVIRFSRPHRASVSRGTIFLVRSRLATLFYFSSPPNASTIFASVLPFNRTRASRFSARPPPLLWQGPPPFSHSRFYFGTRPRRNWKGRWNNSERGGRPRVTRRIKILVRGEIIILEIRWFDEIGHLLERGRWSGGEKRETLIMVNCVKMFKCLN